MTNSSRSHSPTRLSTGAGRAMLATAAAALLLLALQAQGADTADGVAVDDYESVYVPAGQVIRQQISANEARRAAYRYMSELGYARNSSLGSARVRSVTREGDTWILTVAYTSGGRTLSRKAVLFVDANTALVSELPPGDIEGRVAAE